MKRYIKSEKRILCGRWKSDWEVAEKYLCQLFEDVGVDCGYVSQFPLFDKILNDIVELMQQYEEHLY